MTDKEYQLSEYVMGIIKSCEDNNKQGIIYKEKLAKVKIALKLLKQEKYRFNSMFQNRIISFSCSLIDYLYQPAIETQYLYCMLSNDITKEFLNQSSLEVQEYLLNYYPQYIKFIDNQSLRLQWVAIKRNPLVIQYIKNPSKDVKYYAVKRNGVCIQYIKNPSEYLQMTAVEKNILAFNYIENPTKKVMQFVEQKLLERKE